MLSNFSLAGSRPNLLLFLVDDWPWELWPSVGQDLPLPNNYSALMPNIAEHFEAGGLTLTHAYTHKISSPSRRALMSGRFLGTGIGDSASGGLTASLSTLGDRMHAAGYYTAFLGKWFCGWTSPSMQPAGRGFDTSVGFYHQSIETYGWDHKSLNNVQTSKGETIYDLFVNATRITREHEYIASAAGKIRMCYECRLGLFEAGDHLNASGQLQAQAADEEARHFAQDVLDAEMVRVIDEAPLPLFAIMSTPGLHKPLDSRHHQRSRTFDARGAQLAANASCPWHTAWSTLANPEQCSDAARGARFETEAMALGIDDSVGLATARLKARGAWADTLMVFISDNGGLSAYGAPNTPLRGGKNSNLEGGVRVRCAMGGGALPAALRGQISRTVLHEVDLLPTFAYLGGLAPYDDPIAAALGHGTRLAIDGRNLAPSWRRRYEAAAAAAAAPGSTASDDELVPPDVADWCPATGGGTGGYTRTPAAPAADCVRGTRLLWHDNKAGSATGGYTFTLVVGSHVYKVYGYNAPPCSKNSYWGCPWDPGHASWRPSDVCPSSDPECDDGPCAESAVSGDTPCGLFSPTNAGGCSMDDPCVFDIAADPTEATYLTLEGIDDPTLTAVAQWYFAQGYPSSYDTYTPADSLPGADGHGYSVSAESEFPNCDAQCEADGGRADPGCTRCCTRWPS